MAKSKKQVCVGCEQEVKASEEFVKLLSVHEFKGVLIYFVIGPCCAGKAVRS